ncbi:GLPGLI family protein [Soonwooa sp.]|uniref:GLPGLI family protein n=1 Tax=Soonwooa sp. TaxID=1938592 RepID=UPI00262D465F|nr:GLPGLI family protein [Soonwooa sp.]
MIKKILILFVFFPLFLFSQEGKSLKIFTYKLTYVPDSTNIAITREENFDLEVDNNGDSNFTSVNYKALQRHINQLASKSIGSSMSNISLSEFPKTKFTFSIYKSAINTTIYEGIIGNNNIFYNSVNKFDWKITQETKLIDKYTCQKATLKYGGRSWEAWFTTAIPISDGPYVFQGLPGLIIEMTDTNKYFSFSLIEAYTKTDFPDLFSKDYFKHYYEVKKDEARKIRRNARETFLYQAEQRGLVITPDVRKSMQDKLNKQNNFLEK